MKWVNTMLKASTGFEFLKVKHSVVNDDNLEKKTTDHVLEILSGKLFERLGGECMSKVKIDVNVSRKTKYRDGQTTDDGSVVKSTITVDRSEKGRKEFDRQLNESLNVAHNSGLAGNMRKCFGDNRPVEREYTIKTSSEGVTSEAKIKRDLS